MDERSKFLETTRKEREERERQKTFSHLAINVQSLARGTLVRRRFRQRVLREFDEAIGSLGEKKDAAPSNIAALKLGLLLLAIPRDDLFIVRFGGLCRVIAASVDSNNKNITFPALFLSPEHIKKAKKLVATLFCTAPEVLSTVDLDKITHNKAESAVLSFLLAFGCANNWALSKANPSILPVLNGLCSKVSANLLSSESFPRLKIFLLKLLKRRTVNSDAVNALFTIIYRVHKGVNNLVVDIFIENLYTCPGLIRQLSQNSLSTLRAATTFDSILTYLSSHPNYLDKFTTVETLNLLANWISISFLEQELLVENLLEWVHVVNYFFDRIQRPEVSEKKKVHWHPILGYTAERVDADNETANNAVRRQLQQFWSKKMIAVLFGQVLNQVEGVKNKKPSVEAEKLSRDLISSMIRGLRHLFNFNRRNSGFLKKLSMRDQPEFSAHLGPVSLTAVVCELYQNALRTFQNIHIDIISGLCHDDSVLTQLWAFINNRALRHSSRDWSVAKELLSYFGADSTGSLPHFAPISLFADMALSLISILDEHEMYELGKPFSQQQLIEIASFVNNFCFRAIWDKGIDFKQDRANNIFMSLYQLCILLHNRDVRREFTRPGFWHCDVRGSTIIGEYEKKSDRGLLLMEKMPHLIPLKERMMLFRRLVAADKLPLKAGTVATISRNAVVEDGFRFLSAVSSRDLKIGVRIKFVNQQGLEEPGIDQDGVFKEFLELTVKGIFDPQLNLFRLTSNGQLYPSNTSSIHPQHLEYFYYIGRILGKSVYEGYVVDVQLAPVLLATILNKQLCAFDELALVDPDLYKSLTYVKHYKDSDDVADLELTFSCDEEFLGQVKTVDLIPSGRSIKVTNENKIYYIHTMAQYRIVKQTKKQCDNFVAGFRSIVNPSWISLFSMHELQKLISGMSDDIDIEDLRRNVQYYGGFHSNHRVIKWLWQIVTVDFSTDERKLFLKFVTSFSRAPLLGFAYLEPPFSIRCIESDEQEDTLGSVVRGFLALKSTHSVARLPSSSTCFNLLKLPNYSKKSILLEKLRYAIHAQAGFELS